MTTPPPFPAAVVPLPRANFDYQAQTGEGQRMSGTIEATSVENAMLQLQSMRLRVIDLAPAAAPTKIKSLGGDDFRAFNQQLAHLTAAGLPVERGLRLIAADMRRGRLAKTIEALADELEKGAPLEQAFEKYRGQFPPLYGKLIGAGVRSGNLSAVLLNLGRHLEIVARLRSVLWRTVSYPIFVLIALGLLLSFMGIVVLPLFQQTFDGLKIVQYSGGFTYVKVPLPWITQAVMAAGRAAPALLILMGAVIVGGPIVWSVLRRTGRSQSVIERLLIPMPLVGPVLRFNLVARWCDAARLGVQAGMDLPAAIELAGDATASPRLIDDGWLLTDAMSSGKSLADIETRLLPATVPAAIQFALGTDLAATLASLSDMYQRQAELAIGALPAIFTPILLVLLALVIGFVIFGLMAPLFISLKWLGRFG